MVGPHLLLFARENNLASREFKKMLRSTELISGLGLEFPRSFRICAIGPFYCAYKRIISPYGTFFERILGNPSVGASIALSILHVRLIKNM